MIDVRVDDPTGQHEKVLRLVPDTIPVYRVVSHHDGGTAESSSYLFVNGRWRHFQNLVAMPDVIPKLDQLLRQIPDDAAPKR